jgi:hypothetical protein
MASTLELLLLAGVAQLAVTVNATPVSTTSVGTVTSGTTEVLDSALGTYQCTLIGGRRYMAVLNNALGSGSEAADLYKINIRNSGTSSTPTTSSTIVATTQWYVSATGGSGSTGLYVAGSFIAPASGTNTLGVFAQRAAGSGTMSIVSGVVARELFVMYLGAV